MSNTPHCLLDIEVKYDLTTILTQVVYDDPIDDKKATYRFKLSVTYYLAILYLDIP